MSPMNKKDKGAAPLVGRMNRAASFAALGSCAALAGMSFGCQKPSARPPKPFTLILSTGGGFSGAVHGCTLNSQGEAKAWEKLPGGTETALWSNQGAPDSALALAEALRPFLSVTAEETGNMTTRIRLVLPDTAWQWSKSGIGSEADAAEPFRTWYARAEAYCRSLKPEPEGGK